jgi:hypothetical protein
MVALAFLQSEQSKVFMVGENVWFDGCVNNPSLLAREEAKSTKNREHASLSAGSQHQ